MREAVNMSNKDLDRLHILKKVQSKELTQVEAGRLLKLGERQIRRLLTRFKEEGSKGIISKLVGRQGNRNKPKHLKQRVLALLKEKYEDFGPTLAAEKLFSFGEDGPEANATVLIDDATGIITGLFFSETETLEGYFKALEQHLHKYGRPRALYTDRYSVFCSPKQNGKTQMQIALEELEIQLILARSPQAKGRVERVKKFPIKYKEFVNIAD